MKMQAQPTRIMSELDDMKDSLDKLVIGQDDVLQQLVNSLSRCIAGLANKERSLLSMLFLGPTGVGKTETARALAEVLFGNRKGFTRINCQEYSAHYNISKLLGSPPGYVGGEIRSLLAQENLERHFKRAREKGRGLISKPDSVLSKTFPIESEKALSILVFDELEKAHPKLWNMLLSIIDDGSIVLGNNEEVDFTNTIIICTSNVGSRAITSQLNGVTLGFDPGNSINDLRRDISKEAKAEAEKVFPPELLGRIDETVVFNALDRQNLLDILEVLINRVCGRAMECASPFILEFSEAAKYRIVDTLGSRKEGARPLSKMLEKDVVTPVSHRICGGKINGGELVTVDVEDSEEGFIFCIESGQATEASADIILPSSMGDYDSNISEVNDDGGAKEKIKQPKTRRQKKKAKKLLLQTKDQEEPLNKGVNKA